MKASRENQKLESVVDAFIQLLVAVTVNEDINREVLLLSRSYGSNNAFVGWPKHAETEVIAIVKSLYPQISEDTISGLISDSVKMLFESELIHDDADPTQEANIVNLFAVLDEEKIFQEVQGFLEKASQKIGRFDVYIPIRGIDFNTSSLSIGQAFFEKFENSDFHKELEVFVSNQNNQGYSGPGHLSDVLKLFGDAGYFVNVSSEGDFEMARIEASEKASKAIDILNYYLAETLDKYLGYRIVLEESYFGVGPNGSIFRENFTPLRRYKLNSKDFRQMKARGLERLIVLHGNSHKKPNSMGDRISKALKWYSNAIRSDDINVQFVSLAIALESLLISGQTDNLNVSLGSITQKLADYCAFLLTDELEERLKTERTVKDLYRKRSKIVHAGETISKENLRLMNKITLEVIDRFIKNDYKTMDEFYNWIRRTKYSQK